MVKRTRSNYAKGQLTLWGDTLIKFVRGDQDLYRKHDSWSIDEASWEGFEGVRYVEVHDAENEIIYHCTAETFEDNSIYLNNFKGQGAQLTLPREYFRRIPYYEHV